MDCSMFVGTTFVYLDYCMHLQQTTRIVRDAAFLFITFPKESNLRVRVRETLKRGTSAQ